jgi:DNA-binding MarR family transcriptional regulator
MNERIPKALLETRFCVQGNLHRTARIVDRIYAEEMKPCGIGRSQFTILNVIHAAGSIGVTALADFLAMERSTLSRNLKPLENAGLVERLAGEQDARKVDLCLTAAGENKLKDARRYWRRAQQRVVGAYGADQWQQLDAQLKALRSAADANLAAQ